MIALSVARNRRWLVDIRVSRNVIFHSSTLLISGIFLLAIGVAGEVLRDIGVTWGPVLEIALVFGALVFVAVAFTSGRARSELRVFLVQNFFRSRYDYRKVWLSFIGTLSNPSFSGEQLQCARHPRGCRHGRQPGGQPVAARTARRTAFLSGRQLEPAARRRAGRSRIRQGVPGRSMDRRIRQSRRRDDPGIA